MVTWIFKYYGFLVESKKSIFYEHAESRFIYITSSKEGYWENRYRKIIYLGSQV